MIDPQAWPPLCGAVAGCGALLVLSGAAKLLRTALGTGGGTAVQKALRLSDAPWRIFQAAAGAAELAVGLLVCAGTRPVVADTAMACQGTIFVILLTYLIRARIPGDCGCVARRRPATPDRPAVTRWSVARAVYVALAGVGGALADARSPYTLPRLDAAIAWTVGLGTLALLAVVDLEPRTPRCRRPFLFPARTTLAEVTAHPVYQAMAASLGASGDRVLFRRSGCVDEFWFPAPGQDDQRYLEIIAGRTEHGTLALRAAIAERAPVDDAKTLPVRSASTGSRTTRAASQPSGRGLRLHETLAPGAKAWLPLNFLDNPVNGATSCPAFSSFAVTPPGVGRAYTVQAPDSGAGYPPDCGGIEVPPVLSTAETVIPSGG